MKNSIIAATGLVFIGSGFALAQADLLPSNVLMRQQGQAVYRDLNNMVKGEAPFDQAKANEAFAKLAETAAKLSTSFPESSKGKSAESSRNFASPKVWEMPREFNAEIAKMIKAIEDNRGKVTSLEGLKAAYPAVNAACNSCHETFRLRKS